MFDIPPAFAEGFADREGEAGRAWLASLPAQGAAMLDRWSLRPDGPSWHGFCSVVQPVRRADGAPAVLKIGWPHPEAEHEALALRLWDGDGAVRLLTADGWSLLLERLDADRTLMDVPLDKALEITAELIRRLDRPAPAPVRHLRAVAERLAVDLPADNAALKATGEAVDDELIDRAVAYCRELGPVSASRLVNEDLHYENVLGGAREPWLVIDPKPIAGDPEFGLIPMLWNRHTDGDLADRLDALVEATGMDRAKARKWTLVRAVESWLWSDDDDPAGQSAEAIIDALS
ncbi:aminoglycoside phosphotransferase family protein [Actinokineospora fastidiosa]|uniref:Aminoglycoside O-phosphotransferase n=1 Tax=Actinokineospora fastidiosa TaxID=1816 RepID=A0A918G202_9PSEU|nr:aminoglycoside phosphotransferase family protein [Actinokineospora fastidiosa]GGS13302.1 aminoglycoside O-phosphotransferase [Actinokineospora fastidiosa]